MTDRALDETTSTLRTLRAPWIALAIAAPIFVSLVFIYPQGDFAAHMDIARALARDGGLWTYPLWYPLQHALSIGSYNETTMGIAAVVIALASITLKIYIAEWYARSERIAGESGDHHRPRRDLLDAGIRPAWYHEPAHTW